MPAFNLGDADAEKEVMAQLSRTYQVVLVLVAVLALAWFTVLHNQISGSSGGSSSSGAAQSAHPSSHGASGVAQAGSVSAHKGASTRVYHGPVPGLHGLSKDIRRAHEAVSTSNAQSRRLESASGSTPAPGTQSSSSATAHGHSNPATKTSSSGPHHAATGGANHSAGAGSSGAGTHRGHADSRALTVSRQLRQGKVVLLLFWKSKSFDDQAVHSQVQAVGRSLGRSVAVDFAKPREVGAFGTVTADVRVLQTPTLLVIDKKGLTTTIAGLTDAFSIEQAVREAR